MKPYYNENRELTINFGKYSVVQKKKDFNVIYFEDKFLCHRNTWKSATKIAQMLKDAFDEGYSRGCY